MITSQSAHLSSGDNGLKEKLTMLLLGSLVGAGTYTVAKRYMKSRKNEESKQTKDENNKMKQEIIRNISGIQE